MGTHILIAVIVGLIVAGIYGLVLRGQLKSVAIKTEATNYIRKDSLKLDVNKDLYLCTNIKRTERPKQNTNS